MFVNVSPTENSAPETQCSLQFAERVRKVELGAASRHTSSSQGSTSKTVLASKDRYINQLKSELVAVKTQLRYAENKSEPSAVRRRPAKKTLSASAKEKATAEKQRLPRVGSRSSAADAAEAMQPQPPPPRPSAPSRAPPARPLPVRP